MIKEEHFRQVIFYVYVKLQMGLIVTLEVRGINIFFFVFELKDKDKRKQEPEYFLLFSYEENNWSPQMPLAVSKGL